MFENVIILEGLPVFPDFANNLQGIQVGLFFFIYFNLIKYMLCSSWAFSSLNLIYGIARATHTAMSSPVS